MRDRPFLMVFVILICLHLLLMGGLRIYPFTDLPNHLSVATVLKYYGEPANQFSEYYSASLFPRPNAFHPLFCGLRIFRSVEFGNRVLYCLYVILLPFSVLLLIRRINGNAWFSLLSFLLLYSYGVSWGFAGFTISIPIVLFLFYFILDYLDGDRLVLNGAIVTALLALLFFTHILAALFALLLFFVCCLYRYRNSFVTALKRSAVVLPSLALIATWWRSLPSDSKGPGVLRALLDYYKNGYLRSLYLRRDLLILDNLHLYTKYLGYIAALFFFSAITVPVLWRLAADRRSVLHAVMRGRGAYACLFALSSLLCFLLLPAEIIIYNFIFERFSVFFLLSVVILGGIIYSEELSRARIFAIVTVCVLHFALWTNYFIDFEKENRLFTKELFPETSANKKLAGLIYDYKFRGRPVYIQFPDYYTVWRQGIATSRFIEHDAFPVKRKIGEERLPRYLAWVGEDNNYDGRYANMDYILVRGNMPKDAVKYMENFELYRSGGKWVVYKRKTQEKR